jgi:uncharacterized Zn finger protein
MREPKKGKADPAPGLEDLVSRIEAELTDGTRADLRKLLAQLMPGRDEDNDGEIEEVSDPYGRWDLDVDDDLEDDAGPGAGAPRGYWWGERAAGPLAVEGGLVAASRRGPIGESWWSKRFLAAVESALSGGRSARGRAYARRGQVIDLTVEPGLISARVQGSRPQPYRARIAMPVASDELWGRILSHLASQAGYSASMLAGELPHEIEEVFASVGVALFPSPTSRLSSGCSCPDMANPCKHVAAVCYLVAELFDRDPFTLLAWRGYERGEVLRRLRELTGAAESAPSGPPGPPVVPAPPLSECLADFWRAGPGLASVQVRPEPVETAGAVLAQLARGRLDIRGHDLGELLHPAYREMSLAAVRRAVK